MLFPINNIEVIIERNGIKHIADVKLRNGKIIEFQHSSLSINEIKEREDFYDNMIWVFNASESFEKHHIHFFKHPFVDRRKYYDRNKNQTIYYDKRLDNSFFGYNELFQMFGRDLTDFYSKKFEDIHLRRFSWNYPKKYILHAKKESYLDLGNEDILNDRNILKILMVNGSPMIDKYGNGWGILMTKSDLKNELLKHMYELF